MGQSHICSLGHQFGGAGRYQLGGLGQGGVTLGAPQFECLPRDPRIGGLGPETHRDLKCGWVAATFQGLTFRTLNAKAGKSDFASNANNIGQTHGLYLLR